MLKKNDFFTILEWSCCLYVAGMMILFGTGKYSQFNHSVDEKFKGMKIMWEFYSYSKPFVITLGIFEVLGAVLLLIPKTRITGCLFLTSLLTNVILQDYFYEVPAIFGAVTLQLIVFFILWLNRTALIDGIKAFARVPKGINSNNLIKQILYITLCTTLIFVVMFYLITFLLNAFIL
ncbi:DoxX family protein [Chryseobacterium shigense]|uniref:Putative membrane protein n=1 Tax=Chryseobacterium shigense TaxID=297244 RepID=A0A841N6C8_9FLAO|nr:DoxX family protein [Chryseobacterium shigense]MBB6372424.1 putative membrane protein [Chryseobacterium shigense]